MGSPPFSLYLAQLGAPVHATGKPPQQKQDKTLGGRTPALCETKWGKKEGGKSLQRGSPPASPVPLFPPSSISACVPHCLFIRLELAVLQKVRIIKDKCPHFPPAPPAPPPLYSAPPRDEGEEWDWQTSASAWKSQTGAPAKWKRTLFMRPQKGIEKEITWLKVHHIAFWGEEILIRRARSSSTNFFLNADSLNLFYFV